MLSIIGIVAIVVFGIQIYKSAVSTERNAAAWTIAGVLTGIGIQFVIPIVVGICVGIYIAVTNTSADSVLYGLMEVVGIAGIVFSIVGMWIIWKRASIVKDENTSGTAAPPPPPMFR